MKTVTAGQLALPVNSQQTPIPPQLVLHVEGRRSSTENFSCIGNNAYVHPLPSPYLPLWPSVLESWRGLSTCLLSCKEVASPVYCPASSDKDPHTHTHHCHEFWCHDKFPVTVATEEMLLCDIWFQENKNKAVTLTFSIRNGREEV